MLKKKKQERQMNDKNKRNYPQNRHLGYVLKV